MIKTLLRCLREYKLPSILTPIFVSIEVVVECIIPFLIARLVNYMQAGNSLKAVFSYGALLVVLAFVSLFFGAMAGTTCAKAASGFAKNIRHDLFYRVQDFSFSTIRT